MKARSALGTPAPLGIQVCRAAGRETCRHGRPLLPPRGWLFPPAKANSSSDTVPGRLRRGRRPWHTAEGERPRRRGGVGHGSKEKTEHTHPVKPPSGWREIKAGRWEGSGAGRATPAARRSEERCLRPAAGPASLRARTSGWDGGLTPLHPSARDGCWWLSYPAGTEAEQAGACCFQGGGPALRADAQGKGRDELGKCILVGHAAPLMETHGHLAAHACLKKRLSRAKGNAQLGAHACMEVFPSGIKIAASPARGAAVLDMVLAELG